MARYRRDRPLEAAPYELGMENGITAPAPPESHGPLDILHYEGQRLVEFKQQTPHWNHPDYLFVDFRPYLLYRGGRMYIRKGDYIITEPWGRFPVPPNELDRLYIPL